MVSTTLLLVERESQYARIRVNAEDGVDMAKIPANMAELNGYIPKDLKRRFKSLCVDADRSMSDVLVELIDWCVVLTQH